MCIVKIGVPVQSQQNIKLFPRLMYFHFSFVAPVHRLVLSCHLPPSNLALDWCSSADLFLYDSELITASNKNANHKRAEIFEVEQSTTVPTAKLEHFIVYENKKNDKNGRKHTSTQEWKTKSVLCGCPRGNNNENREGNKVVNEIIDV